MVIKSYQPFPNTNNNKQTLAHRKSKPSPKSTSLNVPVLIAARQIEDTDRRDRHNAATTTTLSTLNFTFFTPSVIGLVHLVLSAQPYLRHAYAHLHPHNRDPFSVCTASSPWCPAVFDNQLAKYHRLLWSFGTVVLSL